ncbi:hypothetical protein [Tolypothrix sp. VBCCA 56010]|uniref:hypothetical protein n=1 Tax=Tolypothrix sp. VBCCA 56010 TaxID=3137731 RepID=UPI003D7DB8B7
MLKHKLAFLVLSAVVVIAPTFTSGPANAQTKVQVVAQRDQVREQDGRRNYREDRTPQDRRNYREDRTPQDRRNSNRDDELNRRIVRLGNGDVRLSNGDIVPARRLVRLRDGYFRLPNGDILLPNEEIVPSRRLVRVRDGYFRLPNGVTLQINL